MTETLNKIIDNILIKTTHQIDILTPGATALYYSNANPGTKKPIIYDMPSIGGQVHLHENKQGITGGRLYTYDRKTHKTINATEGALLDLYAKKLNINRR